MVAKQLYWRFKHVQEGQMEPDSKGRWLVVGSVRVPIALLPKYEKIANLFGNNYIDVDVAHISYANDLLVNRKKYRFKTVFYYVQDANNGLRKVFYCNDFEDSKKQAQEKLNHLVACLAQPIQTPPKETVFSCLKSAGSILWQNISTRLF